MADDLFPIEADCNDDTSDDYEVGYAKPPKSTQFKKGISGNPAGRPKKPRDFGSALLQQGGTLIKITENGRSKWVTKMEGLAILSYNKAVNGSTRDRQLFIEHHQRAFEGKSAEEAKLKILKNRTADDYTDEELTALIRKYEEEDRKKAERENKSITE